MSSTSLVCIDEQRRHLVRRHRLNGIDYVEVEREDGAPTLRVYLLDKAPGISRDNVLIEGGRRVRDLRVVSARVCRPEDGEADDCLRVTLDRAGDMSTYRLCLVEADEQHRPVVDGTWQGRPRYQPLAGFDPRYACIDFTFSASCDTGLDCGAGPVCPVEERPEPEINYLAKDYASFRRLILDRLALLMPDWQERHVPDLGITLAELLAYTGDYLSYYQDAVATEAYLDTARQRISVRRHARLVDYTLSEGCNARAWVFVRVDSQTPDLLPRDFFFVAAHVEGRAGGEPLVEANLANRFGEAYEVFEPLVADPGQPVHFYPGHNELHFYTWGDRQCCLPRGTTEATLCGPVDPPLEPGDFLLFEEVLGPETGATADADPGHRQVVRLAEVRTDWDPVTGQPVVEIAWEPADALSFPLCLSAIGQPPDCALVCDISVARGNLILVDHGRTVGEGLEPVPPDEQTERCLDEGQPVVTSVVPGHYRPVLEGAPLTFSQPLPPAPAAAGLLAQDPRQAVPAIGPVVDSSGQAWLPRADLLASQRDDPHFVVEMDDKGYAHLRFGDGELGRRPPGGATFAVTYRTGNGPEGNVGAEAISYVVFRHTAYAGIHFWPRNPLPAQGGTAPESLAHARLAAPHAFRSVLRRAIIPEDYAAIVMRDFAAQVQRAAATLRWTGSGYEVLVAIDPRGGVEVPAELLAAIHAHLRDYRRIGHGLVVQPARYAPLELELTLCLQPHALRGQVKAAVLQVLGNRQLPGGRRGLFHPDNLSFGEAVYLSPIVATVQAVPGVEAVVVETFRRAGRPASASQDERAKEEGLLRLGPLEIARLDNDPSLPENGRLKLNLEGGR